MLIRQCPINSRISIHLHYLLYMIEELKFAIAFFLVPFKTHTHYLMSTG